MAGSESNLRAVFCAALERASPHDREEFLDQACQDKPEIRLRVRALLQAHDEANSFLQEPNPAEAATALPALPEPVGTTIGPYKLMELIGEGGMGLVYVAEQHHPVRRKVALKLIKPGMDTRQVIARFEAERQALALMEHPNIAKVLDAGTTEAGRPYFVMELVKGLSFIEYCDQHRLTTRQRLDLFMPVCRAVQHAHQKGVIHRDLKPANIMVSLHDVTPVVKVIDFGIAKAVGQQLTDKTVYTGVAQLVGTPQYMSPEQAGLSNLDVDTRSDIYALGVLLYELLTGTTPFEKETLSKASYEEMRRIIREEEPPKPSTRLSTLEQGKLSTISEKRKIEPRKLSSEVRGELDWIVMKALEKDRNRRYESAGEMAADVERYLNDEPVEACPPSAVYRARKFVKRHQAMLVTVALPLLVLLLGGGGFLWWQERQSAAAAQAVAKDLDEAEIWQRQDRWNESLQALERAYARLEGSGPAFLRADVIERRRQAAFVVHLDQAQLTASDDSPTGGYDYATADTAYVQAFTDGGFNIAAMPAETIAQQLRGSPIRSRLVAALDHWIYVKENLPKADPSSLHLIVRLADSDAWRRKLRDPRIIQDQKELKVLAADDNALTQPTVHVVILSHRLARANARDTAVDLLRKAQRQHPLDFWINYDLGRHLGTTLSTGEEGIGFLRVALACNPKSSVVYNELGVALRKANKISEAVAAHGQAIALRPNYACAYCNLGIALYEQRKPLEAFAAWQKAIELNPDFVIAHLNLGMAFEKQQRFAEAIAAYSKAIELNPNFAGAHLNVGIALAHQQKLPEAEAAIRKATELEPRWPEAYSALGVVLIRQKRYLEALVECRKAFGLRPDFADAYENAAGAAALAGCGQGDGATLDAGERAHLRGQALGWLRGTLIAKQKILQKDSVKEGPGVMRTMQYWQQDPDFSGVRGEAALAQLPDAERQAWLKLWEDVEELKNRAANPK